MAKHLSAILKQYSDVISGKLPASKVSALTTGSQPGVDYAGKMPDEREFVASHSVEMHPDRNGNGDELFKASNIGRAELGRHGHVPQPKDIKIYKQANEEVGYDDEGWEAHREMHGDKGVSKEDWRKGIRLNSKGQKVKTKKLKEAKDPREYGYEGEMAISQIKSIMNHSGMLMKMLKPDTDMPEWVQSKITLASDYIQTAADYFATEMTEESELAEVTASIDHTYVPNKWGQETGKVQKIINSLEKAKISHSVSHMGDNNTYITSDHPKFASHMEKLAKKADTYDPKIYLHGVNEESKLAEAKCNMTEAGTMCEVHGTKACSNEETKSASDKEPRYNGKDKPGMRKLLTDKKNIQEKAESVAQQKLMALALQHKRGEMKDASSEVKKLASSMTEKQLRDYAATKHKGLPQKVQKEQAPADTPITFPVTNSREGFKL